MLRRFVSNRATVTHRSKTLWKDGGLAFAPALNTKTSPQQQQQQRRGKHTTVALQLDYYMSPQFAGIACALTEGLYESAGIDTVTVLSTCPVGLEPERVRQFRDIGDDTDVVVGSIEQNVLLPTLLKNPHFKVKAVAAMFEVSPLCLVSLNNNSSNNNDDGGGDDDVDVAADHGKLQVAGAHEDTVDLLKRILIYDNYKQDPKHSVVASPRATKITDLLEGRLDAIQAYTTTEVLTLERIIASSTNGKHKPEDLSTILLEGHNGAKLGYSQVLFAPEEDLVVGGDQREILKAFLGATFEGWAKAIRDPEHGARCVKEAQDMLGLSDEGNDHWDRNSLFEYNVQNTRACCDLVKATNDRGGNDKYGVIDPQRWDESTQWLLNENISAGFGLDATVWEPGN